VIVVSASGLKQIVAAAEKAYPLEACGLLVGYADDDGTRHVTDVHDSPNLAADARHAFEVDPALLITLHRRARRGGDGVIGLYHSHPNVRAQPSQTDLERAWEPDLIWLIASVVGGQAVLTTAHKMVDDGSGFEQVLLRTDDWTPYPSRDPMPWPGLK
jgi:proteasome lid subunit RPN8/RPN11